MDSNEPLTFQPMKDFFFEKYLFDPFCNQVMRLMMIEQFHDEKLQVLYNRYLFELPEKIQMETFRMLSRNGIMSEDESVRISKMFFSVMTTLTSKLLKKKMLNILMIDTVPNVLELVDLCFW